MIFSLTKLETAIKQSWCSETSYEPESWTKENPAKGQCSVTSLVVQDYFGGEILCAKVTLVNGEEINHYYNSINGVEIDLTRAQFGKNDKVGSGFEKKKEYNSTREFMLSNNSCKNRYELLKQKVVKVIS
jgi:hypothetical protein